MTAIADIIVNSSALQNQELQISQNLNSFSQNSSNSISFSEMLAASRSEFSSDNKNSVNSSPENDAEEKVVYTDKTSEVNENKSQSAEKAVSQNDENKTAEKENHNFDSEKAAESDTVVSDEKKMAANEELKSGSEKKLFNLKKIDERYDSVNKNEVSGKNQKTNQAKSKIKSDRKDGLDEEFNRLNQLLNDSSGEDESKTAQSAAKTGADFHKNGLGNTQKKDFSENDIKVEPGEGKDDSFSGTNDFFDFSRKISEPDNENARITKLDKEGKITVKDLRKEEPELKESEIKPRNNVKLESQIEINDKNTATITMELTGQNAQNDILSLNSQTAASNGSNFQAMLSNQIQQNAPEFVKAGSIILKDNNQGTINLVLHPDDLGSVRIHLSLDGKTVSAHIAVNTKEALEVFKDNAQTLREAFAQNGFDTSNFDVSYGNSNGQNQQNFENRFDGTEFIAKRAYSDYVADSKTDSYITNDNFFENYSEYSVNIVA